MRKIAKSKIRLFAFSHAISLFTLSTIAGCQNANSTTNWTTATPQLDPNVYTPTTNQSQTQTKRPGKHWTRLSQYALCSDVELNLEDPFFKELESLPDQIQSELKIPPGNNVVQVYLFETQEQYEAYMASRYPKLPPRRAYFIAEPRLGSMSSLITGNNGLKNNAPSDDLLVFTWMGDHLKTDLRHELTHAVLHSVLQTVPLWLDEGLACFFELPPSNDGVNNSHLESIVKGSFSPDLARLEGLGKVAQMEKAEYREAWAWVHYLLRSTPENRKLLIDYLNTMLTTSEPAQLLPKLKESSTEPEANLVDHLARLKAKK